MKRFSDWSVFKFSLSYSKSLLSFYLYCKTFQLIFFFYLSFSKHIEGKSSRSKFCGRLNIYIEVHEKDQCILITFDKYHEGTSNFKTIKFLLGSFCLNKHLGNLWFCCFTKHTRNSIGNFNKQISQLPFEMHKCALVAYFYLEKSIFSITPHSLK